MVICQVVHGNAVDHKVVWTVEDENIYVEQIEAYSLSSDRIAAYLKQADGTLLEKENLLKHQQEELQKLEHEIDRIYRLHQDGHIDGAGFGRFYKPLEERRKQLEDDLPRLQAEVDVCKVDNLSAEEVAKEAQNLAKLWPGLQADEKRNIVEAITQKIVVGKEEIEISP